MLWQPEEIEVNPDAPFENDIVGREDQVRDIANLLQNSRESIVLAIDGEWGAGKTTFLKFLSAVLQEEHCPTIMFSAWGADYVEDPLTALLAEVTSASISDVNETSQEALDKAKRFGGRLARRGAPILVKLATHGMIDLTNADAGLAALLEETGEGAADIIDDHISSYEQAKESLEGFRGALAELVEGVEQAEEYDPPVVFMVDELDRCRPDFALETLERIKHAFSVPGVSFVLGLNHDQLSKSIQGAYGHEFNGRRYLDRLIDLRYELPPPGSPRFVEHSFELSGLKEILDRRGGSDEQRACLWTLQGISSCVQSLRVQNRIIAHLNLILRVTPLSASLNVGLLTLLVALRHIAPEIYRGYVNGTVGAGQVWSFIEDRAGTLEFEGAMREALRASLYLCSGVEGELENRMEQLAEGAQEQHGSGISQDTYSEERDWIQNLNLRREDLSLLADRIELDRRFSGPGVN